MLAILLSWVVILFVILSFGDILLSLFNKLCKKKEQYNLADIFLLGTCFVTALLAISSLWLPSNHIMLFTYIGAAAIYWVVNKNRRYDFLRRVKQTALLISKKNWIFLGISISALIIYMCWASHVFDSAFYHYQNIRWNEEFAVVPGLSNLESRFGFNSNYLLLSSLFTFRFLFGEAIYTFQSVMLCVVLCWIFSELIKSNFEIKRIILLIMFFFFFAISIDTIADTSTDFVPNMCVFYLVARLVLYPHMFKDSILLYFIIPVSLFTFKVSSAPFCIISLVFLIHILRNKEFRTLSLLVIAALLIVVPWISRTVIITGYLFYPLSAIDVFSFDWELDKAVVDFESFGISVFAHGGFSAFVSLGYFIEHGFLNNKLFLMSVVIMTIMCAFVLLSPFVIAYKTFKKQHIAKSHFLMYIALLVYTIYHNCPNNYLKFANSGILDYLEG